MNIFGRGDDKQEVIEPVGKVEMVDMSKRTIKDVAILINEKFLDLEQEDKRGVLLKAEELIKKHGGDVDAAIASLGAKK